MAASSSAFVGATVPSGAAGPAGAAEGPGGAFAAEGEGANRVGSTSRFGEWQAPATTAKTSRGRRMGVQASDKAGAEEEAQWGAEGTGTVKCRGHGHGEVQRKRHSGVQRARA